MSNCNTNFLLVSENIIVNESSEKVYTILKKIIEGKFHVSLITDYVNSLIPKIIPFIGIILIPIFVYLFVNRIKLELPRSTNVIIFLLFNSFIISSICFSFIYSYNLVMGVKSFICNIQTLLIENFYIFQNTLDTLTSITCLKLPNIKLKSTLDDILRIIETSKSYVNIYYSLVLVSLQVFLIPTLLFTSITFEKCKRKFCFYSLFTIIVTLSWTLGCIFLPAAFVTANIDSLTNNFFSDPLYYLGKNCITKTNGVVITPCNMLTQCNMNPSRNLMIGILNGSDTDTYEHTLQKIISKSTGSNTTMEQNSFIFNIISNETTVNTIEGLTAVNGTAQVNDVVNLLQTLRANTELYVNQGDVNPTRLYIDNIIDDIDYSDNTITNDEFLLIINNKSNIPVQLENRTLSNIVTIPFSTNGLTSSTSRRRLSQTIRFGDTRNYVCLGRLLSRIRNINIPCSTITRVKKMGLSVLSNSSLLYFIFSCVTCLLSFIILPFFTEPGRGRPIKLPQIKYNIK